MGMRLSDERAPLPNYCWGASILDKLHGRHRAPVGERYCAECKAKNAAVVAQLKAQRS